MKSFLVIACLFAAAVQVAQGWSLQQSYSGSQFFDGFAFFTAADPTHGFVQYLDQSTAMSKGLAYVRNGQAVMRADNSSVVTNGRPSVRIVSTATYESGLFVFDFSHMPAGCGTWPAYWLVGPNWPNDGEMDLLEGVNKQASNMVTLHTSSGCTMENVQRKQSGKVLKADCNVGTDNQGCGVQDSTTGSYGTALNKNGGGVIATQWTADGGIQQWFFARNKVPGDIRSGQPKPQSWGTPVADFPFTECASSHFRDMSITINLDFCGDWAGAVYGTSGCPSDCVSYVGQNPHAFNEAYWAINSIKVYQQ